MFTETGLVILSSDPETPIGHIVNQGDFQPLQENDEAAKQARDEAREHMPGLDPVLCVVNRGLTASFLYRDGQ
jgi:hypothetical protein